MPREFKETDQLLRCAGREARQKLFADLFMLHRGRLRRMSELRLDRRLQRRLDPSDAVQEAYLEASRRLEGYLKKPRLPFFHWLRWLTGQKVVDLHRRHLGARLRDVRREAHLPRTDAPSSSRALAAAFLDRRDSPSKIAEKAEARLRLRRALDLLEPLDRQILAVRHFEQLSNAEAARELGIAEEAAKKRYFRALRRLKQVLGGREGEGGRTRD